MYLQLNLVFVSAFLLDFYLQLFNIFVWASYHNLFVTLFFARLCLFLFINSIHRATKFDVLRNGANCIYFHSKFELTTFSRCWCNFNIATKSFTNLFANRKAYPITIRVQCLARRINRQLHRLEDLFCLLLRHSNALVTHFDFQYHLFLIVARKESVWTASNVIKVGLNFDSTFLREFNSVGKEV